MATDTKPHTIPVGTHVTWHYRGAIGHGTVVGVHKAGATSDDTEYSISEHDHHVSESGSKEKPVVYHYGRALTVVSERAAAVEAAGTRVAQGGGVRFVENATGQREVDAKICSYGVGPDTYSTTWSQGWSAEGWREAQSSGTPIPVLFGHDERSISNVIGSVAGLDDRADGLYARIRMADFDEVPSARAAYSLMRDGHIGGFSFKFRDGKAAPDPQHRGAMRFERAKLVHVAAVIDPSIPGTATVGVRSETQEEEMDTAAIAELVSKGVREGIAEGLRAAGIAPQAPEEPPDPKTLALSVAGAFTAACAMFDARSADLDGMGELGQLLTAGAVAADELCDALGVDPQEVRSAAEQATEAAGTRAAKEPYGDVEYADPGYQADKKKRYPLNTHDHVKSALSYIGQADNASKYSAEQLAEVKGRIAAAAKKFGIDVADDDGDEAGKRSTDDGDDFDAELEAARAILERR